MDLYSCTFVRAHTPTALPLKGIVCRGGEEPSRPLVDIHAPTCRQTSMAIPNRAMRMGMGRYVEYIIHTVDAVWSILRHERDAPSSHRG